jgi:hypothetical protein
LMSKSLASESAGMSRMVQALPMPALLIKMEGEPRSERMASAAVWMAWREVMSHL